MKKIGILASAVILCALIFIVVILWSQSAEKVKQTPVKDKKVEEADLRKAEKLLKSGNVNDALKIIHMYEEDIGLKTEEGRQWLNLLIDSSVKTANFAQLIILYEAYPRAFDNNEQASLMVADGYILSKQPEKYQAVRSHWKDKAKFKEVWIALDADDLLLEGKKDNAKSLLESQKFEGKKDVDRLVRLALLNVVDNPQAAWDYLAEAYKLDPTNPDIITYRGKLLESLGKDNLALYEYLAAIQAAPDNLFLRDQLAEFYMRHNQVPMALSVWLETLSKPSLDLIWIKALFWSKVSTPVNFDWAKASPPTGADKAFIEYLIALPKGVFWDEDAFDKLTKANSILNTIQASFWLRILQDLKNGDEKQALNLLQFNNFSDTLINPQLAKALKQILSYRLTGSLDYELLLKTEDREKKKSAPVQPSSKDSANFFDSLNDYASRQIEEGKSFKLPQDIHDLITSKEAFAAAFLSTRWLEAALQLHKVPVLPDSFPDWVAIEMTQAYRSNRSNEAALQFALEQKKTPTLSVMIGELYIATNKEDEALKILLPFVKEDTDIGYRAATLVSQIYLNKQEYDKAKELVESQPKLASDTLGKEILARIALLQGNADLADKIYTQIEEQSPEAMSYLARKAFAEKNWDKAKELTEKLLLMFPDSPILRENMSKIVEEQNAKKNP